MTANFGLMDIGMPKAGETVQIRQPVRPDRLSDKLPNCRAAAWSALPAEKKKCRCTEKAGFDAVIDYKSEDVSAQIAITAVDKWDIFFDNVGGPILEAALNHMSLWPRRHVRCDFHL